MAAESKPRCRIRLVFSRSSTLLKCIVLVAIILSTMALLTLRLAILDAKGKTNAMRNEAAALEKENSQLEKSLSDLGTVQSVKELAGKLLGLVDPDTVIFLPEQ